MTDQLYVAGAEGVPVYYRRMLPAQARAGVLLSHGYSEHSGRYLHVMEAFAARGFAVVAPDHRGHGHTARVHGDLEGAELVLGDLAVVHRQLVRAVPDQPIFMVGHSMGALIALRYLERWGSEFRGAIVNGPAVQIPEEIPVAIRRAARVVARVAPRMPIQDFYNPERSSRDPAQWRIMDADPLIYKGRIRARTGREILKLIRATLADLSRIELPVLVTHGAADITVAPAAGRQVYEGLASQDKTFELFDGLRHETHQEPEKEDVIGSWSQWLEDHL